MSDLIVDIKAVTSADTSESGYTEVVGLTQSSVNVDNANNIILLMATVPIKLASSGDTGALFRFAIDDVLVGPEMTGYTDEVDGGCGGAINFATTLSAGNHKFALQWKTMPVGPSAADVDEVRGRSLQVIEITDSSLLFDLQPTDVQNAGATFADATGLTVTATPAANSVHIFLVNLYDDHADGSESVMGVRMTIGGTAEGPEMTSFKDTDEEGCGQSFMWMKTGLAASSTDFAVQWKEELGAVLSLSGRIRSFQCIEITANVTLQTALDIQTSHSLTGSFANIAGMTSTFSADSTDSIILMAAGVQTLAAVDNCGAYRFADEGTLEGPQNVIFGDDSSTDFCGHSIYYAKTAAGTGSRTYTLQGVNVQATQKMDTTRDRSFCALELKAAAAGTEELFHHRQSQAGLQSSP